MPIVRPRNDDSGPGLLDQPTNPTFRGAAAGVVRQPASGHDHVEEAGLGQPLGDPVRRHRPQMGQVGIARLVLEHRHDDPFRGLSSSPCRPQDTERHRCNRNRNGPDEETDSHVTLVGIRSRPDLVGILQRSPKFLGAQETVLGLHRQRLPEHRLNATAGHV